MEETTERIDYSRLKQQEKIYFYDDVILYEDELADNGTALLSAKIVSVSLTHLLLSVPVVCHVACDGIWLLSTTEVLHESRRSDSENERY